MFLFRRLLFRRVRPFRLPLQWRLMRLVFLPLRFVGFLALLPFLIVGRIIARIIARIILRLAFRSAWRMGRRSAFGGW